MQRLRFTLLLVVSFVVTACGTAEEPDSGGTEVAAATTISVHVADVQDIEVTDVSVGWIASKTAPAITSEVSGRLIELSFEAGDRVSAGQLLARVDPTRYRSAHEAAAADVERLRTSVANQQRQLARHQEMLAEGFIAQAMFDDSQAQLRALEAQLRGAQARLDNAEKDLASTRIVAPISGIIDQRLIATGDFVQAGQPLAQLVSDGVLRIHLPFPETVAERLRADLPVRLNTPIAPAQTIEARISELRPALGQGRAVEAIIEADNPGAWRTGASVRGEVVLETRRNVLLPEAAVVLRPAGHTVYVVDGDRVHARPVTPGVRVDGMLEILDGVEAGERVALDGAGFLTDQARIRLPEAS